MTADAFAGREPGTATRDVPCAGSVAIVHDYLNQLGGAERVVLELGRIWRGAPIYTSLYRPESTFPGFAEHDIRTSPLDALPVDRRFRALAPLLPVSFRLLGTLRERLVVSSSSGWAHGVRSAADSTHVVYCHSPPRWLYDSKRYFGSARRAAALLPLRSALCRWDRTAARRADLYIANSKGVRDRLRAIYGIDAPVVPPPVQTSRFSPTARGEGLLVISRLLPYKRVDLAVAAADRLSMRLDVVGEGPELAKLRRLAGPTVRFHGAVDDTILREMLQSCSALCVPAEEDFGMVAAEANAAGKAVVAFARGGSLENQVEGRTAVFFRQATVDALVDAIREVQTLTTSPQELAAWAAQFSSEVFRTRFLTAVREQLATINSGS